MWGVPTVVVAAAAPALAASPQAVVYCTRSTTAPLKFSVTPYGDDISKGLSVRSTWTPDASGSGLATVGHVLPEPADPENDSINYEGAGYMGPVDLQGGVGEGSGSQISASVSVAALTSTTLPFKYAFGSADTLLPGATITIPIPTSLMPLTSADPDPEPVPGPAISLSVQQPITANATVVDTVYGYGDLYVGFTPTTPPFTSSVDGNTVTIILTGTFTAKTYTTFTIPLQFAGGPATAADWPTYTYTNGVGYSSTLLANYVAESSADITATYTAVGPATTTATGSLFPSLRDIEAVFVPTAEASFPSSPPNQCAP